MKKILILLVCISFTFLFACNKPEKEEIINTTNATKDTNTTTKKVVTSRINLEKSDTFNGNINIKNTINNTVFFQKINFSQVVDLNFTMDVLSTSKTGYEIEVLFNDCSIDSEFKDLDVPQIIDPFNTLNEFAKELNGKSFILAIDENGKVVDIKNWQIDPKYMENAEAYNEINKYFSKNSLAMIFEKITYTGPNTINEDDSWSYSFAFNNTIPIQSECTYNCIDINDYYYVIDVTNSKNSKATSNKISFPSISGNAKIIDSSKGDLLISKNKGIAKRASITFDCNANINDLTLLNLKIPASITLSPLTTLKIELNIPLV
ncbi:MAG: DUF6263 family protein [Oscillospiraceae bacterium]|nr:DUF6263 family protein [Oscillospiraceae bacterium]